MKSTIAACAFLTVLLCAGDAFAVPEYGYVTNGGSNQVRVFDPLNAGALIRNIPVGATPRDIIGVPARGRLYVANYGAIPGTISIIDSDRLEVVNTVTVPDSESLSGMSYCPLIEGITVAGRRTSTGMAAIFLLDLNSETVSLRGEGTWSVPARDCSMVAAGGGKTYFSVPGASPNGALAVYSTSSGTVTPLSLPAGTASPTGMDRSPDGTFVYVGCRSLDSLEQRLLRIEAATDAISVVSVGGSTGSYETFDVSFRRDVGPPYRAYVVGTENGGASSMLYEYDATAGTRTSSVATGGVYYAVFHHGGADEDRAYLGTDDTGVTDFARWDTSTSPPSGSQIIAGGSAPTSFAFMLQPSDPLIYVVLPKGGPASGITLRVEGQGFMSGAVVLFDGVSQPTTYGDGGTLFVTPSGLFSGNNNIQVRNPNLKTASLQYGYTVCSNLTPCLCPVPLPPLSQGYAMRSVPLYTSVEILRNHLAAAMGPYNPSLYRVFFWRGGRYVELPEMGGHEVDISGESFWVVSRSGGGASVPGLSITGNTSFQVVPLRPGWNMISLPFKDYFTGDPLQMDWSTISVTSDGAAWSDAGPANATPALLHPELFEFVNGGYAKPSAMVTERGYFVLNRTGSVIYLLFDNGLAAKPSKASKLSYAAMAAGDPVPPAPPGDLSGQSSGHSSGRGCGLLGAEVLLLLGLCRMIRRRRAA